MDPRPKVVLFEFAVKIVDDTPSDILSSSATLDVQFWRNDQHLVSSGPMRRDEDGCVVVNIRLIILAIDILVVNVFKVGTDDELKLGSVYIDLEDLLEQVLCGNSSYIHDAIVESEDFPPMQLMFGASSFPPSSTALPIRQMPNFLAFEICSAETTDADFMIYLRDLDQLMHVNIFLILVPEQFHKLRERCFALASASDRLFAFTLCAGLLDDEFRATSNTRMYALARLLYQDFAAALGGLGGPMQFSLAFALTFLPDSDASKTIRMQAFGRFLIQRHLNTGDQSDLTQGIFLLETVNQLRAGPYSGDFILDQFMMHSSMYDAYLARYNLSNNVLDLDMALAAMNKAVELQVPWWTSDEQRPAALHALALSLLERFKRLGAEHDLERAAEAVGDALAGVLADSPEYLRYLSTRELILSARFQLLGDMGDYEQAMEIDEELIMKAEDSNSPEVLSAKHSLAMLLLHRYSSSGDVYGDYIEHPIEDVDEFVAVLRKRFKQTVRSDDADLRRAIVLLREVVDNADRGVDRFQELLGQALLIRFKAREDKADLDEAIAILSRISLDSTTAALTGLMLGQAFNLRYVFCGRRPADIRSAILVSSRAATSFNLTPTQQFFAAQFWIASASRLEGEDRASGVMEALKTAMSIIPSIVWIGMSMQDRHDILMMTEESLMPFNAVPKKVVPRSLLSSIGQTPNRAAAFAVEFGEVHTAIEWLEQGRSIIWDQLLQFHVPLDVLREADPGLAQKLELLAKELSRSSTMPHFWRRHVDEDGRERKVALEAEGQKHRRLVGEWQQAVSDARKLPGLHGFLLPKDFEHLSSATDDGIVVIINASSRACDALIIFPAPSGDSAKKDVLHVPLTCTFFDAERMHTALLSAIQDDMGIRSDLTRKAVFKDFHVDQAAGFREILGDIWYKIVQPIIYMAMVYRPSLVNCVPGEPRAQLRWCPTGPLTFLPLHAAGDYTQSEKGHRVFDFIISSYIPTLNSIIRRTPSTTSEDSTIKVLAVACPYVKGQTSIPDTVEEVTRMGKHVVPLLDQPMTPVSRYTPLVKKTATAERVLEEMKEATWVHLACHGTQDATSPTNSALLLSDGTRLLLSDIAAIHLPHAELAFLSACQTATGYDKIPSESVHLAAGMLLAGYRSVIGTMWSIEDRHAPHVADDVYAYLLRDGTSRRPDYRESGLALHLAMEKLRERIGEDKFLAWVPYIHVGV